MPVNWSNNHFLRAFELDEIFLPLFFHVSLLTAIRLIRLVCVEWSDREQYLLCMLRHTLVDAILCWSLYPACASVVHVALPASHAKAIFVVCKTNKYVDRLEQNEQRSGKNQLLLVRNLAYGSASNTYPRMINICFSSK